MIFLTVGTQFPFDRLVRAVDEAAEQGIIDDQIIAQVGESAWQPRCLETVATMAKNDFDDVYRRADAVISHAGMGSITQALDQNKPLLVMPRRKCYGEVVNDHQVDIAEKFTALGHLLMALEAEDIARAYRQLRSFVPRPRQNDPRAVQERVRAFLTQNHCGEVRHEPL